MNGEQIPSEAPGVPDAAAGGAPEEEISLAAWRRRLGPLSRRAKAWIAVGLLLFVAVSVVLARWLQTENVERDADLALIEAQARGDLRGMLAKLEGCERSPRCVATAQADARNPRLLHSGPVKILQLESNTSYALAGTSGRSRVAWKFLDELPVVQCVTVRRTGNFLSGMHVHLTAISAPIGNEAAC